jgi:putative RecB family exonuclease
VIDLVRSVPGGGLIVDFKTSSSTPAGELALLQNQAQLTCYAVLYRAATGEKELGLELHHLVKTKQPKLVVTASDPIGPDQESSLYRAMESYVAGVEREDYVPSPGIACSYCEYFNECRKWQGGSGS